MASKNINLKKRYRVVMIGAGSGFTQAVLQELCESQIFKDDTVFIMVDISENKLETAYEKGLNIIKTANADIKLEATCDRRIALNGADYVITACEKNRIENWIKDIEIPEKYGVYQIIGENGGPGGQFHAARNITMFIDITRDMEELCPDAWLMNFTNPMSFICTYLNKYTKIKSLGLCHQVHGSFGVVAEMLGMEPGELEVISGGINHFNWLIDIRRRGVNGSYLEEFLEMVRKSPYWNNNLSSDKVAIPEQMLTLEVLDAFGAYPIGYDSHIVEYLPFAPALKDRHKYFYNSKKDNLKKLLVQKIKSGNKTENETLLNRVELQTRKETPFPKNPKHPYYREKACIMMEALESNKKVYVDSMNVINRGAIPNLPYNGVVDVPVLAVNGIVNSIYVGELPVGAAELCRRQMTIHEIMAKAVVTGDRGLLLQSLCLDPYIGTLEQARGIMNDMLKIYRNDLPTFYK